MNERDKETVIALAENSMNVTDAAVSLGLSRNTVVYRIGLIKEQTGLDPRKFFDLHKLLNMATGKDVKEVVLCKNCDFSLTSPCNNSLRRCSSARGLHRIVEDDDFCPYGERKDNG